ncbi:conserved hypothetical protein [Paraburkholderia ribeironis]|uniref:Uncharacterized protein n=1 Tax=Paraburkholderia ribeironis TaxID=1247936 RepID=A0A1N7SMU4_9BURK|nr:hypothetical protein [Paraburkholderia ribeironis]SIT48764.1 conserved hypothetical protein [Paraburkholderia ribeironis]
MSEKFDMKVVIDSVTTPLLHARLSEAKSYRERAAVLRQLAEAALRGVSAQPATSIAIGAATPVATPTNAPIFQPDSFDRAGIGRADFTAPVATGIVTPNEQSSLSLDGHNTEELADAFGAYF